MTRTSLTAAIEELKARDRPFARLVTLVGVIRHRPRPYGNFGTLARSVIFQQLGGAAARAIFARVLEAAGGAITPERLSGLSDRTLRTAGLSANKLASLRDLSAKVLDGTIDLGALSNKSDDDVVASLIQVRGIGRWTAEMYLIFVLRRLDIWPVEDLGVRRGYGLVWAVDPPPLANVLGPLGDRFRPYRSVVARYCWEAVSLFRAGTDLRDQKDSISITEKK